MPALRAVATTASAALRALTAPPTPTPTPNVIFVVPNTGDMGPGSLRSGDHRREHQRGFDAITFNIPGADVQTIAPGSATDNY